MKGYDYFRPQSLDEVWRLIEKVPDAKMISGGTDLLVQIKNQEIKPRALISLRSIKELAFIKINGGTQIGALTTISDILNHQKLQENYPLLGKASKKLGSEQIRNVATIGGNLCNASPSADTALPLLVLEAKVTLQSARKRREIPMSEFITGPGQTCLKPDEILTNITLGSPLQKTQDIFMKMGRVKMDLAIASMAFLLELEGRKCRKARIAVGSVAPVPLRLYKVENLLENTNITQDLVKKAQKLAEESVSPITDIRATEEYRRQIIGVFLKRGFEKIFGWNKA